MGWFFLIGFVLCFLGYATHTYSHYQEYKRKKIKEDFLTKLRHVMIPIGYFGWFHMLFADPTSLGLTYFPSMIGLLIGIAGFVLYILSVFQKKGYGKETHLITKGIYSKIRNPMYLGIILMHVGFPVGWNKLFTLASAVIWIPQIFVWRYWEGKRLEKRFGKEYLRYKKRTVF